MTRAILTSIGAFAIVLLLALAACMPGDGGGGGGTTGWMPSGFIKTPPQQDKKP